MSAAVTGSGRYKRPLQEAGGGDGSGRYIYNALRQDASTVASGSLLVLPRAAADTRWQYSTLHYTGGSTVCYAMQGTNAQHAQKHISVRYRLSHLIVTVSLLAYS